MADFVKPFSIKGLVAATFTPYKKNGEINLDLIDQYVDFLIGNKVKHIFLNGTTGEGTLLTIAERKLLVEKWLTSGKNKLESVTVNVGAGNLKDAIEMAVHAQLAGADAIGLMAPTFFKPKSNDVLVEYCRQVASAAPKLPFFYYHLPQMTGIDLCMEDFLSKVDVIPTFHGMKFSGLDLTDAARCLIYKNGKYQILYGCDTQMICALSLGIESFIGSTYNFMAPVYNRLIESFQNKDLETAKIEQYNSQALITTAFKHAEGVSVLKPIMEMSSGMEFGAPRCPIPKMAPEHVAHLRKELETIGYFKWISSQ